MYGTDQETVFKVAIFSIQTEVFLHVPFPYKSVTLGNDHYSNNLCHVSSVSFPLN